MSRDPKILNQTRQRLRRAAMTSWPFENRLPGFDLPVVLKTVETPHMRRMVTFRLVQQWQQWKYVRMG